ALGQMWLAGKGVQWDSLHKHFGPRRVPLPLYPFERRRYWRNVHAAAKEVKNTSIRGAQRRGIDELLYTPTWKRSHPTVTSGLTLPATLVFTDDSPLCQNLVARLEAISSLVIKVFPGRRYQKVDETQYTIDPAERAHYCELIRNANN